MELRRFLGEQCGDLPGVCGPVVGVAVVHEQVDFLGLSCCLLHARHPLLELGLGIEVAEALDHRDALGLPGLRPPPWKRMTANLGEVTATIGGTELRIPCGASTITNGIWYLSRRFSVRPTFFSLNQDAARNSTAIGTSASRSLASTIAWRASFEGNTHLGNCRKMAPSLPAEWSGATPSRDWSQIA